ncbi:MAG: VCBS repeat-containing protein [Microcoleus sp. SM1_3_4]|nr:VCBS repeat-containing protein [Microcoleus sp. SM1_3_4]
MSLFSTATNFPVGDVGEWLSNFLVADFNKDGKPDIVTAYYYDTKKISILLGTGTGSFGTATNFNIGFTGTLAFGDFNSDGNLDIACVKDGLVVVGQVAILLGNGTGSFSNPTSFDLGEADGEIDFNTGVGVGDFNNDGKLDLVTIGSNNLSILLGTGTGSFGAATNLNVNVDKRNSGSFAVEDFNADGKLDLAFIDSSANVSVLLGKGTGSFGTPTKFKADIDPYRLETGDFNKDNKPDLFVTDGTSDNVSILFGKGTGSFGTPTNFNIGETSYDVAVGDFNSDNKSDLVVTNENGFSILLGNGTGSFDAPAKFSPEEDPYEIAIADFNADGKTDLVTTGLSDDSVSVLLNNNGDVADSDIGNEHNDTPCVSVSLTQTTAIEGGANGSYELKLTSQPTAAVTINITTNNQIQSIAPLTFTPNNWNVAQTVTVKAVNDTVAEGTHSANITHKVSSNDNNYNGISVPLVKVTIDDNDTTPTPTPTTHPVNVVRIWVVIISIVSVYPTISCCFYCYSYLSKCYYSYCY